jgi:hypothetical protein
MSNNRAQRRKERRQKWREVGLCVQCGDIRVDGLMVCQKHKEQRIAKRARKQQRHKNIGLCTQCTREANPGSSKCSIHERINYT